MQVEYYSIPQLVIKTGICDNTIRRYSRRFPEFFVPRVIDGVKRYHEKIEDLVKRVYHMYTEEGKQRREVKAMLESEFADIKFEPEIEQCGKSGKMIKAAGISLEGLKNVIKEALNEVIQIVNDQKQGDNEQIQKLNDMINSQNDVIEGLKKQLIEVKDNMIVKSQQVHPNDYRKQIIDRIFDMKDNKGMTFTQIVEDFNNEGIKTFSGTGKWSVGTLSRIYKKGGGKE